LTLKNNLGEVLSSNFYWLPAKLSTFDWDLEHTNQHAYYSAVTSYEDLTALNQLPQVQLQVSAGLEQGKDGDSVRVQVHNPSHDLAFQINLGIHREKREDQIVPVFWEDNYLSLLPGESRVVVARYSSGKLEGHPELEVTGWNIAPMTMSLTGTKQPDPER
jgi:exo-1,4-beta-D-glucosaminidase